MLTAPAPSPLTGRCSSILEEMRAELGAHGGRKGPRGMLLAAIVRFMETLLAQIVKFQAGELAAPGGRAVAVGGGRTGTSPRAIGSGPVASRPQSDGGAPWTTGEAWDPDETDVGSDSAAVVGVRWGADQTDRACHPSPSRSAGPSLSLRGRGITCATADDHVGGDESSADRSTLCAPLRFQRVAAEDAERRRQVALLPRFSAGHAARAAVRFAFDSKNGVLVRRGTCDHIVAISK